MGINNRHYRRSEIVKLVKSGPDFSHSGTDDSNYLTSLDNIRFSQVKIFWAPKQALSINFEYHVPPFEHWPIKDHYLDIPNVTRFIWEDPYLDGLGYYATGFSGTYSWGVHTDDTTLYIASIDPDPLSPPISGSSSIPWPNFSPPGTLAYGINRIITGVAGPGSVLIQNSWSSTWFAPGISGPFALLEGGRGPNNIKETILSDAAFAEANFTPEAAVQYIGVPPFDSIETFSGFFSYGETIIRNGQYVVDGDVFGIPSPVFPPDPIVVGNGFSGYPDDPRSAYLDDIDNLLNELRNKYTDEYPHLDIFKKPGFFDGMSIPDFLSPVICNYKTYFATNVVNILYLAKPRDVNATTSDLIDILLTQSRDAPSIITVILIAGKYMKDSLIPDDAIEKFKTDIENFCESIPNFIFAGDKKPSEVANAIYPIIDAAFS